MMKRHLSAITFVFALLVAASCVRPLAQDAPTFRPEQVPAQGRSPEDFVPRGWKIGGRADGDLDGDRVADFVLQLVPEDYDVEGIKAAPESQALLILTGAGGGRLRRAALATKLLVPAVPQYIFDLSVKNGVLVVHQNYGMTDVVDLTHRFRYEPASGRFLLIGKDTFVYHRPQGPQWPATKVSENYLTGVRLTTTDRWLRDGTNSPTTKRGRVERTRVFFEDVDEDPDN
ncbi:MAG TPA: hypothetical protein VGX48_25655 [Pyrinomonadaceae bacterium]|jgi:hypothetical protein|nr:hypothetical protein [Pyrinomonadaceae bacterium]